MAAPLVRDRELGGAVLVEQVRSADLDQRAVRGGLDPDRDRGGRGELTRRLHRAGQR
ncbi:hypothetical protein ACFU8R_19505 [Pseudonocardia alni]|uniref:Uncharacterized protein n=1 Tax=Pseudonocardia alni TaxID=33907 RepID=A0A852WBQ2_PSEA5|nr:hypothetical protein [Pseudonocardia antarctica]NYG04154.1 hypothetical protein [Pseudonocardia antarctica]